METNAKKSLLFRWLRFGLYSAGLGVVAILVAPWIISRTSVVQSFVDSSVPVNGRIIVGSTSLGWFSAPVAYDVQVLDADSQTLGDFPLITGNRSLLSLILDSSNLGAWTLYEPTVTCELTEQSSSIDQLLEPLFAAPSDEPGSSTINFAVHVADGTIRVRDRATDESWEFRQLQMESQYIISNRFAMQLTVDSDLQRTESAEGNSPTIGHATIGHLATSFTYGLADAENALPGHQVAVSLDEFEISAFNAVFRRFGSDLELQGSAEGATTYRWSDDGSSRLDLDQLAIERLGISSVSTFGEDAISGVEVLAHGGISIAKQGYEFSDFHVASELGKLDASGKIGLPSSDQVDVAKALKESRLQLTGSLDLRRLAATFPHLLHVRDDVLIQSGDVAFRVYQDEAGSESGHHCKIAATNLTATRDQNPITWEKPFAVEATLRPSSEGLYFDNVTCDASFASLTGSGRPEEGKVSVEADLDELFEHLRDFIDTTGLEMAGRVAGNGTWRTTESGQLATAVVVDVADLKMIMPGMRPWHEPQLQISGAATAAYDNGWRRIDHASIQVVANEDQLMAKLAQPVADLSASNADFDWSFRGDIQAWQTRLQALTSFADWDLSGAVDGRGRVSVSPHAIALNPCNLTIQSLAITGPGVNVHEPRLTSNVAMAVDLENQQITFSKAVAQGTTVSLLADGLQVGYGPALTVDGRCDFQASLERLTSWFAAAEQSGYRTKGTLSGHTTLVSKPNQVATKWNAQVKALEVFQQTETPAGNAVVTVSRKSPQQLLWSEPLVQSQGEIKLDLQTSRAQIDQAQIQSNSIGITTRGTAEELATSCVLDLQGEVSIDAADLTRMLRAQLGPDVQLVGGQTQAFTIRGPVMAATSEPWPPAELAATGAVKFDQVSAFGFQATPLDVKARTDQGNIRFDVIEGTMNQGKFHLQPYLLLQHEKPAFLLAKGEILENVQITPEMCYGWLKFVTPLVAQATEARGSFSVQLTDTAAVPLHDATQSSVAGVVKIHSASIGPGPVSTPFIQLAKEIESIVKGKPFNAANATSARTWMTVPPQQLPFQLVNGRVYHNSFVMQSNELVIRTRGSVGLDQSLQMIAEVPIPDEWLNGDQFLSALRGQVLQIPVTGTLSSPKIDRQVIKQLSQNFLRNTANRLLEDQLNRGLNKLFGK